MTQRPSWRAKRHSLRTYSERNDAAVITRIRYSMARIASSICCHQSRPPSMSARSRHSEKPSARRRSLSRRANALPSERA